MYIIKKYNFKYNWITIHITRNGNVSIFFIYLSHVFSLLSQIHAAQKSSLINFVRDLLLDPSYYSEFITISMIGMLLHYS